MQSIQGLYCHTALVGGGASTILFLNQAAMGVILSSSSLDKHIYK